MYVHTRLARDSFPELELAFFSPFPQQCQLLQSISFRWNGEFEFRSIHGRNVYMNVQGQNEMDLPFRFDFSQKSCFPANFRLKLTCKRKDRKFMYFFLNIYKIRSIHNFLTFERINHQIISSE